MTIRKQINKDFFKNWTSNMAYVLGFFAADGNIIRTKNGGFYISFYSSDKDLLLSILESMDSEHKLSQRKSESVYRFQIGSKEMFNDLILLSFIPNKVKRMKLPIIPKKFTRHFIRGYFDGDGNVWSGIINRSRKNPTKVLQVAFTSSSKQFLEALLTLLKIEGINGGSLFKVNKKNCSRLMFSTLDALKLYEIMYNVRDELYLARKKLVFEKFIKMRL